MKENERSVVARFICQAMRERYGSEAYALPEIVFTAWCGGELLGAMALSMSGGEPFHLEKTYALDRDVFPGVFDRTKIAQFGRWAAKAPDVSEALVYAAVLYALHHHCVWGIGEVKPYVARRFARMGINVVALSGAPIIANIPIGAIPYYLVPPPPLPVTIVLAQAEAALRARVTPLMAEGAVVLQCY